MLVLYHTWIFSLWQPVVFPVHQSPSYVNWNSSGSQERKPSVSFANIRFIFFSLFCCCEHFPRRAAYVFYFSWYDSCWSIFNVVIFFFYLFVLQDSKHQDFAWWISCFFPMLVLLVIYTCALKYRYLLENCFRNIHKHFYYPFPFIMCNFPVLFLLLVISKLMINYKISLMPLLFHL